MHGATTHPLVQSMYGAIHAFYLFEPVQKALANSTLDLEFIRLAACHWDSCPSISIDYALMEKINNLLVVCYDGSWNDMGSWESVWRDQDKNENDTYFNLQ